MKNIVHLFLLCSGIILIAAVSAVAQGQWYNNWKVLDSAWYYQARQTQPDAPRIDGIQCPDTIHCLTFGREGQFTYLRRSQDGGQT